MEKGADRHQDSCQASSGRECSRSRGHLQGRNSLGFYCWMDRFHQSETAMVPTSCCVTPSSCPAAYFHCRVVGPPLGPLWDWKNCQNEGSVHVSGQIQPVPAQKHRAGHKQSHISVASGGDVGHLAPLLRRNMLSSKSLGD